MKSHAAPRRVYPAEQVSNAFDVSPLQFAGACEEPNVSGGVQDHVHVSKRRSAAARQTEFRLRQIAGDSGHAEHCKALYGARIVLRPHETRGSRAVAAKCLYEMGTEIACRS